VSGRKVFGSGSPAAHVFMTMAVLDDPADGPTVLHLALPLDAPGVTVADTWRTLGMRATGSNDVLLDNVFVPEAAVSARRPPGRWTQGFHVIYGIAFPLIYSVYLGVAEAARDLAVREAGRRRHDPVVQMLVGEMEDELLTARLTVRHMVATADTDRLGPETTNQMLMGRTVAARAAVRAVDKAMEVAGGGGFYRALGLERLFRDIQAARYHPLHDKPQALFTGRFALGVDVND
jgi:alkylation response protein AidB-like acyl-CoA dehydrogenase